jgi:hypothetical protein
MSKERVLFLLGIWVAALPYLGFPNSWRKFFFIATGAVLVYISYMLRKKNTDSVLSKISGHIETFSEGGDRVAQSVKSRIPRRPRKITVTEHIEETVDAPMDEPNFSPANE